MCQIKTEHTLYIYYSNYFIALSVIYNVISLNMGCIGSVTWYLKITNKSLHQDQTKKLKKGFFFCWVLMKNTNCLCNSCLVHNLYLRYHWTWNLGNFITVCYTISVITYIFRSYLWNSNWLLPDQALSAILDPACFCRVLACILPGIVTYYTYSAT